MPFSSTEGKAEAIEFVRELQIRSVLDIGPGCGTWRKLLGLPGATWDAVEIHAPYVWEYRLDALYDRLVVSDAATVDLRALRSSYDLAIFGDVIEHMPKDRAVEMVERLPWVHALISVPIVEYPQGESHGNPYEAHVATWSAAEVTERFPVIKHWTGAELGVFLLAR